MAIEIIVVGLVPSRKKMPVDGYIFENEIELPFSKFTLLKIRKRITDFIVEEVGLEVTEGKALNQNSVFDERTDAEEYTPVDYWKGKRRLIVYLNEEINPAVTAELIRCCAINGVSLTLMHYDG